MSNACQRVEPDGQRHAREGQHHADKPPRTVRRSSAKTMAATSTPKTAVAALKMDVSPVSMNC
jgi:hypothetical protein